MRSAACLVIFVSVSSQGFAQASFAQGASPPLAAAALHAEPSSKTPEAFAGEVANVARRCWLKREPAFSGFGSVTTSTTVSTRGQETGVITFAERRAVPEPTRALRILIVAMNRNELTVISQQRGAEDAVPILRRDIGEMLKRGRSPC